MASSLTSRKRFRTGTKHQVAGEVRWTPYMFILVPLVYTLLIQGYAIVHGFYLSLTDANLLRPGAEGFVGLSNYVGALSNPQFRSTMILTLVYTAACTVGAVGLGLMAAFLLNIPFRGQSLVRSLMVAPWAMPSVAAVVIFVWIYNNQFGAANYFLTTIGVLDNYEQWLSNPDLALPAVVSVTVWKLFPLCALVLLAAMQSIPGELYEAAQIDRADTLHVAKNVTLPSIVPTLLTISLFVTIWSLRRFEVIWLMTQGGPAYRTNTIVIDVYRETFRFFRSGMGATMGTLGLLISGAVTLVYFAVQRGIERARGGA